MRRGCWHFGLAFRVTQNPPLMRELTFGNYIQAPHPPGFLEVERGPFRLIPLDGGGRCIRMCLGVGRRMGRSTAFLSVCQGICATR